MGRHAFQFVQQFLGGDNHLAIQYGRGGGTGFGTLARFYYPDFSIYHDLSEARFRVVDVATIQPLEWLGAQAASSISVTTTFSATPA